MTGPYRSFAALYDAFMARTDYRGFVDYALELIKLNKCNPKLILELGCGTGSATVIFKELGYDIIGLDSSADMLSVAREKDPEILYINQDMRAFELYGTVDAVVSLCDSMNYIMTRKGLARVFALVRNYLNPGGLFVFDMNTAHKYSVIGDRAALRQAGGDYIVWDNRWYPEDRINEYRLYMFVKNEDGLYEKHLERHLQRAYTTEDIKALAEKTGFEFIGAYGSKTFREPTPRTGRVFFVLRRPAV